MQFDPACTRCPRLATHLARMRVSNPDYHNGPVAPFGAAQPRLLIVGLAPGAHGANATGRPFTGDYAGILLYQALHRLGLASAAQSLAADDGLRLNHCRITNAVKCLPPANKPSTAEVDLCNGFLQTELKQVATPGVIFALGGIAHRAVLRALGLRLSRHPFSHAAVHSVGAGLTLVDSYHCSRYNTQTRRLTARMFLDALETARNLALD